MPVPSEWRIRSRIQLPVGRKWVKGFKKKKVKNKKTTGRGRHACLREKDSSFAMVGFVCMLGWPLSSWRLAKAYRRCPLPRYSVHTHRIRSSGMNHIICSVQGTSSLTLTVATWYILPSGLLFVNTSTELYRVRLPQSQQVVLTV